MSKALQMSRQTTSLALPWSTYAVSIVSCHQVVQTWSTLGEAVLVVRDHLLILYAP